MLIADFHGHADEYHQAARGILIRRTMDSFRELQFKASKMYRGEATWHAKPRVWKFKNGGQLLMTFCDTVDDVGKYMGQEYSWMGIDEITEFPSLEPYEMLGTCLRSPVPGVKTRRRSTGNPGRPGHQAVKAYFVDVAPEGEYYRDPKTGKTRCFLRSLLTDNPSLLHDDSYVNQLMGLNEVLRRAFLEGDWDVFLGQAFPEWDKLLHTYAPMGLRMGHAWRRWASLDWGTNRPYALLYYAAAPTNGHIYIYRERYGQKPGYENRNLGSHESAQEVAEQEWIAAAGLCDSIIFDPSMDQDHGHNLTLADHFRNVGFNMIPGSKDRISRKNAVHRWLKGLAPDGLPILQISQLVHNLIRTLPALPYATKGKWANEDVDTDAEDHAYDSLGYAASSGLANSMANLHVGSGLGDRPQQGGTWDVNDPRWYSGAESDANAQYRDIDHRPSQADVWDASDPRYYN